MDLFAPWHLIIIIGAILLMFGGKKIPEMMGGIGKGMKEFKNAVKDEDEKPYEEAPKSIPSPNNKKEPLKE
ncbi:MAG TPA: twin-arginine translocase TatA/TatE family subunit [Prolixibacteraceae bacterium]|nr:twin-arginine translocase TatA/TatE family subunit [Prolixibacteraceae bacterium]